MELKQAPRGIRALFLPLKPSTNDPIDNEPKIYSIALLTAVALAMGATWAIGYHLADYGINYVTSAVPFFLLLIVIEAVILACGAARDSEGAQYRAADLWSSLAAGTVQQLWFTLFQLYFSYHLLYSNIWESYRLLDLPTVKDGWTGSLTLFGAILTSDFTYYWFHRMAHEYTVLWAGHNVHHSSEHYNFSTALRQSWRQSLVSPFWHMAAALVFPPSTFFVASQWVTIYQFWIHTCVVRRMGWLEYIFNTPSHHRCHHDRRLHKNFAGVFILWDRFFGTFQDELDLIEEKDQPKVRGEASLFGIRETIPTWSEGATNFMLAVPTPFFSLQGWFIGPGYYTSTALRPLPKYPPTDIMPRIRVHNHMSWPAVWYSVLHYLTTFYLYFSFAVGSAQEGYNLTKGTAVVLFCVATLTSLGLLADGGRKSVWVEIGRVVVGIWVFAQWEDTDMLFLHVVSFVLCFAMFDQLASVGSKSKQE